MRATQKSHGNGLSGTGCSPSPSFSVARRASQLVWLVNDLARQTPVSGGPKPSASCERSSQNGYVGKTRLVWEAHQGALFSTPYKRKWTKWGIRSGGVNGALPTLEQATGGSGSSSSAGWPTPRAYSFHESHLPGLTPLDIQVRGLYPDNSRYWPSPSASDGEKGGRMGSEETVLSGKRPSGSKAQISLAGATKYWPTPAAIDAGSGRMNKSASAGAAERPTLGLMASKNLWPSPRASDGEKGGPNMRGRKGDLMLPSAVQVSAWQTPVANDARNATAPPSQQNRHSPGLATQAAWATPKSSPSGPDYARIGRPDSGGDDLATQMARTEGTSLLNAAWVSQLQGLPDGWLDPTMPVPDAEARRQAVCAPRWPAPPGQPQHAWEAPRTCAGQKGRIKQLEALGNLCISAQIYPVFAAIMEIEGSQP